MQNKNQVFILSGLVAVALLAVGVTSYSLSSGQSPQVNARPAAVKASELDLSANSVAENNDNLQLTAHPETNSSNFTTIVKFEGSTLRMTSDTEGNIYTADNTIGTTVGTVTRMSPSGENKKVVGNISNIGAGLLSLAMGPDGNIYVSDSSSGNIIRFNPNDANGEEGPLTYSMTNTTYWHANAPGAFGLTFDKFGKLWVSTSSAPSVTGIVYNVDVNTSTTTKAFIVPGNRNAISVGRKNLRTPFNTSTGDSEAAHYAATVKFGPNGNMYVADPARGAIWKVNFDSSGNMLPEQTGGEATYSQTVPTLNLENMFVQHPLLVGAAGMTIDNAGNMWVTAVDRNAVVFISKQGKVTQVFRNPPNTDVNASTDAKGRRAGFGTSTSADSRDSHILEFPVDIMLVGQNLYVASFEFAGSNFVDNYPNSMGELSPTGPSRGKISKMDQSTAVPGL